MAAIEEEVITKFVKRLEESPLVSDAVAAGLAKMLADGKVPKVDALLQLIVNGSGDSLT